MALWGRGGGGGVGVVGLRGLLRRAGWEVVRSGDGYGGEGGVGGWRGEVSVNWLRPVEKTVRWVGGGAVCARVGACERGGCGLRLGAVGCAIEMPPLRESLAPAGGWDEERDSLQLLMEMAESMERGPAAVKPEPSENQNFPRHSENSGSAAVVGAGDQLLCKRECGTSAASPSSITVAEIVAKAQRVRLDSWEEIEMLLLDNTYTFQNRPAVCARSWALFRESPKVPRRGKGGQRDLWTNSGGLRGATIWPAPESPAPSRVRRQYGKIRRVAQSSSQHELKFLEYSLVDNPDAPLSAELLQRRLFQTLPIDCVAVKPTKPLRAAIDTPARKRTLSECVDSESDSKTSTTTTNATATAGSETSRTKISKILRSSIPELDALDADHALALLEGKHAGEFGDGSTLPRRPQNLDEDLLTRREKDGFALLFKEDRRVGFARRQAMRQPVDARSADRWKNLGAVLTSDHAGPLARVQHLLLSASCDSPIAVLSFGQVASVQKW